MSYIKYNERIRSMNCKLKNRSRLRKPGLQSKLLLLASLLVLMSAVQAQETARLKGVVVSETNKPLGNVAISVEGSRDIPVVTNDSGQFVVNITSTDKWIIVSPTEGYKTKRMAINGRQELRVYLSSSDIKSGDDQLPALSQLIFRRNFIAAHTDLSLSDLHHTQALTIDEFMQGRVSGMNVILRSGMPGSGAMTSIRGINSLNTPAQPLYVVDGIPLTPFSVFTSNLDGYDYNPLTGINIYDISKAVILKDPLINAAYGGKGSNGVILIETLDPSVTQTTIDVDLRTGLSLAPSNLIPQMNATQHKTLMQDVLYSSGKLEEDIREEYPSLFLEPTDDRFIDYQHNTSWQKLIFSNSAFSQLNVKVKGGDEIARYGLSIGYKNANGVIRNTGYQGYNLRFVSRLNIFTWLKMNAGVSLVYSLQSLKEAASVKETSPVLSALAKSPLLNPYQYDLEGQELSTLSEVDEIGVSNPLATIQNYLANNSNNSFVSNFDFEARINNNLSAVSRFSITYNVLREKIFMPNHGMEHYYNTEAINVAKVTNNDYRAFFNNTYLNYKKNIGHHQLTSSTGVNIQTNKYELDWGLTKNAHENDQYRSLQDGQNNLREIGGANRVWNWLSYYENVNYSFKDRYLVSGSISLDGSSRVGEQADNTVNLAGQPFGLFYAGGLAWRISGESFLKNLSWLEDLKLRISAGKSGNDNIGESSASNYYQAVKFRETVGLYPAVVPNDHLTYETVFQKNAGIDLSLWGNRITASFDRFNSRTDDMLVFSPVDRYLGEDIRVENAGTMQNKGYELSLFVRVINYHRIKWDLHGTFTKMTNEVTAMKGGKIVTLINGAEIVNMEGSPANSYYGYIFKGVYSSREEAETAGLVNGKNIAYGAGDAIYEDLSGPLGTADGVINDYDKTSIGSPLPKFNAGLTSTWSYGNLSLSATIYYLSGNKVFNFVRYKNEAMSGLQNQSINALNRWSYEGQETDVPRALWKDPIGNSAFSTRWIEDGSFFRLSNVSLSYKIPKQFLAFRNAEFYVSGTNLFTSTSYLGYDPEFSFSYQPIHQGIDYGLTPQVRQFIGGIRFGL
ncbi:MAG: SusC/RagA family TonB-linked outer membrane protein [Bacteroidales bacterium]